MSKFSIGQMNQLANSLEVAGYTADHITKLGQMGEGHASLIALLEGRAKIEVAGFHPATFIGKGWSFAGVPTPVKIRSAEDVHRITFFSALRSGETVIVGEETLRRLASDRKVPLGAEDFYFFWNHQDVIPEGWKGGGAIFFDGDILGRVSSGYRYALYLYWDGERWHWGVDWLGGDRFSGSLSAVLA